MCSDKEVNIKTKCGDVRPNINLHIKRMLETTNPYNKDKTVDMEKFYELEKKFT
jgi:hypothetical protein